jgi:hypothetical protein
MATRLRIPFDDEEYDRIDEELSLKEQKAAIIRAYYEKVETSTDIEIQRSLMTKLFDTGSVRVQTGGGGVRFRPVVDPMPAL